MGSIGPLDGRIAQPVSRTVNIEHVFLTGRFTDPHLLLAVIADLSLDREGRVISLFSRGLNEFIGFFLGCEIADMDFEIGWLECDVDVLSFEFLSSAFGGFLSCAPV